MSIVYDKILGQLKESGIDTASLAKISEILACVLAETEGTGLNTLNTEKALNNIIEELQETNKWLRKIYNPE